MSPSKFTSLMSQRSLRARGGGGGAESGNLSTRENLVMTSQYVRPFRVGVSRNESLPSPLESFVFYCFKSFRNDWQIRICLLIKCLVDFRGRPFDFWGGYGWFQRKISCRLISSEKSLQGNTSEKWYPALKKISLMTYHAETKNLTPLYVEEKMSNSRGLGKKFLLKLNHTYPATKVKWSTP